jgi:preprotein translocase subunit SecG
MFDVIFSWGSLWWGLLIIYIPACIGLILIVLLQQGKGTGFAGAFGAGPGGDAIFGKSSQSLPVKITYVAAAIFMVIAVVLSVISGKVGKGAAPDLVKESSLNADGAGATLSDFERRGLGGGVTDDTIPEVTPVETVEVPDDEDAPAGDEEAQTTVEETAAVDDETADPDGTEQ